MLEGLYSAAAGMSAQQQQLEAIGNDLANASTTGYKSEQIGFRDLLYNNVNEAGTRTTVGAGAAATLIGRDPAQGAVQETGNPLDLAIKGEGFFQLTDASGRKVLTRDGSFGVDAQGQITAQDGSRLSPPITLPKGLTPGQIQIAPDGTVRAGAKTLGRIEVVDVTSPDHLLAEGNGEFLPTADSGAPHAASGASIQQGALEGSNVNVASEMTQMITTQRAYDLASNAIRTQDQMLSIANELRS